MTVIRYCALLLMCIGTIQSQPDPISFADSIRIVIEAAKQAKNIWDFVKDLPPTLGEYLTRLRAGTTSDAQVKEHSAYDFVIDLTRPGDIFNQLKSYPLTFPQGKDVYDAKVQENNKMISRFIVNVVGRYNTGKTFLLRMLANIDLSHGFTERTNGLSVALPSLADTENTPMALIDTAGTRTPVEYHHGTFKDRSYERQVSDSFIQEVAISSSEIFVCVVNQLTLDDQLYLETLYNRLRDNGLDAKDIKQRLLLVHNYFNLRTVKEVEATEKYELEQLFEAVKQPQGYWLSNRFKHFVIADAESEAGKKYNTKSIEQIRAMIRGAAADRDNDVLGKILRQIEKLLKKVLVEESTSVLHPEQDKTMSYFSRITSGIRALVSPSTSREPLEITARRQVDVELQIQSLNIEKNQELWFICAKKPFASNVSLSKHLRFAEDGSVHVDYSSSFIPGVEVYQMANGDIQIAVECPSCKDSYIVSTRGNSVIIQGHKFPSIRKNTDTYVNTNRVGPFEIEVPIGSIEKRFVYDVRKGAIKNAYENGVILLTVPRLSDDEEL